MSVAVWLILSGRAWAFSFAEIQNKSFQWYNYWLLNPNNITLWGAHQPFAHQVSYNWSIPLYSKYSSMRQIWGWTDWLQWIWFLEEWSILNDIYLPYNNNWVYSEQKVSIPKNWTLEGSFRWSNINFTDTYLAPRWLWLYVVDNNNVKWSTYAWWKFYEWYLFYLESNYIYFINTNTNIIVRVDFTESSFNELLNWLNFWWSFIEKYKSTEWDVFSYSRRLTQWTPNVDTLEILPRHLLWHITTSQPYLWFDLLSLKYKGRGTAEFYSIDPVDSWTWWYEDLITEQDFKNYNMSMCIEKNLWMVNDFDLRTNLTACKIWSDSNVASGGTDIFMDMIAFYDQIANWSYTTNKIPWDTFEVYDSNVIQNCKDVHTSWNSLMLATRDPNIKPRNDQMLSAYNILDQMRPLYNTNETISHDYEQARSSCELSLNIIYELQKTEITDSCIWVWCIIENIMQQETPIVNSWLNPVWSWIAWIITKIENIFTAITGTNTAIDGLKNAINEKNMSFTWYTDIINNITWITVNIPDIVVDIPDINIDLWFKEWTSTGWIFSFLNEYTTISTQYVFVPNMCKNTTPTDYDNRKNLIMLFMVTITTLSFYFIIIRR